MASSLKKTSIRVLNLNNVGIVNSLYSVNYTLTKLCKLPLEELTLENNYFHRGDLQPLFSTCFPKLQILSLSNNYKFGGIEITQDILKLKHLVGLNISYQITNSEYVSSTYQKYGTHHLFQRKDISLHVKTQHHRIKRSALIFQTRMACLYNPPRHIQWINMSHKAFLPSHLPELVML